MKKRLIIVIALTIVAVTVSIALIAGWRSERPKVGSDNRQLNSVILPAKSGGAVTVPNFIQEHPTYDRVTVLYSDSNFAIQYDAMEKSFQITFTLATIETLQKMRAQAETILLEKLEITTTEACELNVVEAIPEIENMILDKYAFPMSFCPNGDTLPKELLS